MLGFNACCQILFNYQVEWYSQIKFLLPHALQQGVPLITTDMYSSRQTPCFGALALLAHCAVALTNSGNVPDASLKAGSGPREIFYRAHIWLYA